MSEPTRAHAPAAAPASSPAEDDAIIEPAALDRLRRLSGPETGDTLRRVVGTYLRVTPPDVARLGAAIERGEWRDVRALAHKLKSSVAAVGARRLSQLLIELEGHAGRDGATLPAGFGARLAAAFERVQRVLEREIA